MTSGPKILVAVDTHKPTIYALRYANALALATQEKPQLTLFHAINAAIVIGMEGYGPVEHFKQDAHTIIKEVIIIIIIIIKKKKKKKKKKEKRKEKKKLIKTKGCWYAWAAR
jgi:hypothetical protein